MADDFTSDRNTTGFLTAGGAASGIFELVGDNDWFRITLAANTYYTVKLGVAAPTDGNYGSYTVSLAPPVGSLGYPLQTISSVTGVISAFKTGIAGDYFLQATEHFGVPATPYTVSFSAGLADAVGDTPATASVISLGSKLTGLFDGPGDVDVYKIALTAGTMYKLSPVWGTAASISGNMSVGVTDANGISVKMSAAADVYSFIAPATGSYFVTARDTGGSIPTQSAGYSLLLERGPDDYAAAAAGAGALTVGGSTKGKLEAIGDKDWYAVSLNANTTYWFSAKPDSSGAFNSSSAQLKVYDAANQLLASESGSNAYAVMQFVPSKAGTYYFEVGDSSNYYTGNYLASAVIGIKDDYGSDKASAAAAAVGGLLSGQLELAADKDVFKFAVKAGTTYTFELKTQSSVGNPSMYLSGMDAAGSTSGLTTYTKAGATDYRIYHATYTGDYYITVDNSYSYGTGAYTLQSATPTGDDFAANTSTTGLLATGGKLAGAISYTGDSDWIKVKLVAGNKYAFVLEGKGSGAGTLDVSTGEVQVSLTSASGYGGYLNSMSGVNGKGYIINAETTGDYYLSIGASSYYGSALTGSYTVSSYNLTGDSAMPSLVSFGPGNGSVGYSLTGNITLTFDDLMRGGDGYIRLIDAEGDVVESFSLGSSRVQSNGKVVTIDPTSTLQPGTKYTLELPAGSLLDYAGNKFLADSVYTFTTLDTVAQGGSGNDFLSGIGTNVRLSGGDGVDSVVYGSSYASYSVSRGAIETKVLYRGGGSQGSGDVLTGVERLQFADKSIALDVDGNGGQTYRLYQAAFNRTPDKSGLGFWMAQMDKGMSLSAVAESFLGSSEFQSMYGVGTSNEVFIGKLYQNVLHRAGDAAGIDYWSGVLAGGTPRAELLKSFSEGSENSAEILKLIGAGFEYTPYG